MTASADTTTGDHLHAALRQLSPNEADYAAKFVKHLLHAAIVAQVSDVHLQPTQEGLWIRWRVDGVLQDVGVFPAGVASDVVTRLKVLAELLTYHSDIPQEGRIRSIGNLDVAADNENVEMRVSCFPTIHGERAAVRLFAAARQLEQLDDLGFPLPFAGQLKAILKETAGAVLVTGPTGSGKTTTCYACLREIAADSAMGRSVVTIEDPVEVAVEGIAQSQVNDAAGFDLTSGLRSLVRQDPEVVMVSEIRDHETAQLALGASLTGHLVLGSFHASNAAGAVGRLVDMGVEPYVIRNGVLAVIAQRLVRKLCECASPFEVVEPNLDLPVERQRRAIGCEACRHTGYRGRMILAEMLTLRNNEVAQAIVSQVAAVELDQLAQAGGMVSLMQQACLAISAGHTTIAEVRRVFGFGV